MDEDTEKSIETRRQLRVEQRVLHKEILDSRDVIRIFWYNFLSSKFSFR